MNTVIDDSAPTWACARARSRAQLLTIALYGLERGVGDYLALLLIRGALFVRQPEEVPWGEA